MMRTNIEDEISEFDWRPQIGGEDAGGEDADSLAHSKRGAPKIPEQWTWVISIYGDDLSQLKVYQTATDLLMMAGF